VKTLWSFFTRTRCDATVHHLTSIFQAHTGICGFLNYNDKHIATYLIDVVRAVGSGKKDYLGIKETVTTTILQDPVTHRLTQ
jgi:hypothetical protein